ncbi:hypothetical protein HG530_013862 [Fusarium avenaceum]|nr:hypothetical protein HG530_013862 [Fusarium avenaceum]
MNQVYYISLDLHEQPTEPESIPGHLCCWNSTVRFYPCGHGQFFQCEGPRSENDPRKNGNQCLLVTDLLKKSLVDPTQAFRYMAKNFINFAPTGALKLVGNESHPQEGPVSTSQ